MKAHIAELPLYREGTSPSTNWRQERIGVDTGVNRFCGRKLRQFPFDGFCFLCEIGGQYPLQQGRPSRETYHSSALVKRP